MQRTQDVIRRAAEDTGVRSEIGTKRRPGVKRRVGIVRVQLPIQHTVGPVVLLLSGEHLFDLCPSQVVGEEIVMVVRIKNPREIQLLEIVQTGNLVTANFCPGQAGKKQGRQNTDNRYHDQEFNQCESLTR